MSNCTVYCYGENDKCVLGLPEARKYEVTPLLTQADTGTSFLFGIQDDAEQDEQTSFFAPFQIASISTASYPTHTLFLTNYGVCYGAGSNSSNRLALGAGDAFIVSEPTRIRFFTDLNLRVTKCFAFEYGSVWCTDDGSIYFAGRVSQYGTFVNIDIGPVVVTKNHPKFSQFAATYYSIVLLGDDGYMYYKDLGKLNEYGTPLLQMKLPQHFAKQIIPYAMLTYDGHIQKYSFSQDGVSISQFTKLCHPEGDPFVEISDQAALTKSGKVFWFQRYGDTITERSISFRVKSVARLLRLEVFLTTEYELYVCEQDLLTKIQLPFRPDSKFHNICMAVGNQHALFYITHKSDTDTLHNFYLKLRRSMVQGYFADTCVISNNLSLA